MKLACLPYRIYCWIDLYDDPCFFEVCLCNCDIGRIYKYNRLHFAIPFDFSKYYNYLFKLL